MEFPFRHGTATSVSIPGAWAGAIDSFGTQLPGAVVYPPLSFPLGRALGTMQGATPAERIQTIIQTLGSRMRSGPVLSRIFGTQLSAYAIPGQQPEPTGYEFK